jgi:hypothetical protein
MLDVGVADDAGVVGAHIEEVAEIDRLTTGPQRFGQVRDHVERAVPEGNIDVQMLEGLDAGDRGLHDQQGAGGLTVESRERVGHPAPNVVTDDVRTVEAERAKSW